MFALKEKEVVAMLPTPILSLICLTEWKRNKQAGLTFCENHSATFKLIGHGEEIKMLKV